MWHVWRERCAQGFGGETWGKDTIGETKKYMDDNIKMDLEEVGRGCGDWMGLAQDRGRGWALMSSVMNFRFS